MCVQAHFVYSGGQMLPALAQNLNTLGLLQVFKLACFLQRNALDTDNLYMYLFIY